MFRRAPQLSVPMQINSRPSAFTMSPAYRTIILILVNAPTIFANPGKSCDVNACDAVKMCRSFVDRALNETKVSEVREVVELERRIRSLEQPSEYIFSNYN